MRTLGNPKGATWLEPSHGKGAFVEAIARSGVGIERIVAIDLDRKRAPADSLAMTFRGVDFLEWAKGTDRRFDRIVGNPPFVSIAQLPSSLQETAAGVLDLSGRAIGKGANLWYAFVLACLPLLRRGGSLAFILPSAAQFANYCSGIGQGVAEAFQRLELYRCVRPLFDDVQDGTLVAVARGYGEGPGLVARRSFETRAGLTEGLSEANRVAGRKCPTEQTSGSDIGVKLGSVAEIGLGGVTGDAGFFLMNEKKRASLRLPVQAFLPVVSKARQLRSATLMQSDWNELKASGERVWLFRPSVALTRHSRVRHYLNLDAQKGGCNRQAYKVSIRKPWYRTPMPSLPDAFLSGMSQHGPWLCINETRTVKATNTLYVVRFVSRNRRDWYRLALALLSSEARRQLRRIGRRYPDGLVKYEPGALRLISLPNVKREADHKALYLKATAALLSGNARLARKIADSILA